MFPPKLGPGGFRKPREPESAPPWPKDCGSRTDSPLRAAPAALLGSTFDHLKRSVLQVGAGGGGGGGGSQGVLWRSPTLTSPKCQTYPSPKKTKEEKSPALTWERRAPPWRGPERPSEGAAKATCRGRSTSRPPSSPILGTLKS